MSNAIITQDFANKTSISPGDIFVIIFLPLPNGVASKMPCILNLGCYWMAISAIYMEWH